MIINELILIWCFIMVEIDLVKMEGVKFYIIGVGNLVDRGELLNIVISEKYVMFILNVRSLEFILLNFRYLICDGKIFFNIC